IRFSRSTGRSEPTIAAWFTKPPFQSNQFEYEARCLGMGGFRHRLGALWLHDITSVSVPANFSGAGGQTCTSSAANPSPTFGSVINPVSSPTSLFVLGGRCFAAANPATCEHHV